MRRGSETKGHLCRDERPDEKDGLTTRGGGRKRASVAVSMVRKRVRDARARARATRSIEGIGSKESGARAGGSPEYLRSGRKDLSKTCIL